MFPRGVVSLKVTKLRDVHALGAKLGGAAAEIFASITVAGRLLGRTPVFTNILGDVDLGDLFGEVVLPDDESAIAIDVEYYRAEGVQAPTPADQALDDAPPGTQLIHTRSFVLPFPWETGKHELGKMPGIDVEAVTRLVPTSERRVVAARTIEDAKTHSTIEVRDVVKCVFRRIEGLHKPTGAFTLGQRNAAPAEEMYRSADHEGRVYLRHDRKGNRIADGQSIEVTVEVQVVTRFPLDDDVKVKWRLVDVDDPSDDLPKVSSIFRGYLDPGDHNPIPGGPFGTPLGPHAGDNEGAPTKSPPWEGVAGYALSGADAKSAVTTAKKKNAFLFESKVVIHCPSRAGDNFILEAEPVASAAEVFMARTGVITMWQRLDIQPMRTADVTLPPLAELVRIYEGACFQLDVAKEKALENKGPVIYGDNTQMNAFFDKVDAHPGERGWFTLIFVKAWQHATEKATTSVDRHKGPITFGRGKPPPPAPGSDPEPLGDYIEVPVVFAATPGKPRTFMIDLPVGKAMPSGGTAWSITASSSTFEPIGPAGAPTGTRLWLDASWLMPEFTAGDGSLDHAYTPSFHIFPTFHHKNGVYTGTGFGVGAKAPPEAKITEVVNSMPEQPANGGGLVGVTSTRTIGGRRHFTNWAFVLAEAGFDENGSAEVAAHELGHALGFPHRCGYLGVTPRRCVMQYDGDWSFTDWSFARLRLPYRQGAASAEFCPRHQKELRRVVLEDNPAYQWGSK
jgi:hypothetical protein